ncbi:MAG: amidohydrolase family protein, partial [Firmicutes bacterium]|nr:amidohydrolase family protein [Bacillota bacterium]
MNLLLKNIGQLVTPTGKIPARGKQMDAVKVFNDAVIAAENGMITYAGNKKDFDEAKYDNAKYTVIDCKGNAVIPGFVDSHTHLVFGGYRANEFIMRQKGMSYMDIMQAGGGIAASVEATKNATEKELTASALARINELK